MRTRLAVVFLASFLCPMMAYAETGIYIDGVTGWADQSGLPSASAVGATSISTDDFVTTVWGGDIGYNHDFARYIGAGFEVDAGTFGETTYTFPNGTSTIRSPVIGFLAAVTPHWGPVDFLFKAGLGREFANVAGLNSNSAACDNGFEFQTGLAYNIIPHLAVDTVYMRFDGEQTNSFARSSILPTINAVLVGVRVIF